ARRSEGLALALADGIEAKAFDRGIEDVVPVELGPQMQEHTAQPDGGAVHEHKLTRHPHRTFFLQRLVHGKGFLAPVLTGRGAVGDLTLAVLEQRPIDEAGPDVENIDQLVAETDEAPGL